MENIKNKILNSMNKNTNVGNVKEIAQSIGMINSINEVVSCLKDLERQRFVRCVKFDGGNIYTYLWRILK